MPAATSVIGCQYYLFSVNESVHTLQKKTHVSRKSSQKHENHTDLLQTDFAVMTKEVIDSLWAM